MKIHEPLIFTKKFNFYKKRVCHIHFLYLWANYKPIWPEFNVYCFGLNKQGTKNHCFNNLALLTHILRTGRGERMWHNLLFLKFILLFKIKRIFFFLIYLNIKTLKTRLLQILVTKFIFSSKLAGIHFFLSLWAKYEPMRTDCDVQKVILSTNLLV